MEVTSMSQTDKPCPECGKPMVDASRVQFSDEIIKTYRCNHCKKLWQEFYEIVFKGMKEYKP